MIAGLAWYGQDVVNRDKPESLYLEEPAPLPEKVYLNPQNFNLAFGIQDPDGYEYRDQSIYYMDISFTSMVKVLNETTGEMDQIWDSKPMKGTNCTVNHF